MTTLKEQHDQLMAIKPDDVAHDEANCSFCSGTVTVQTNPEGGDMKTYTEDEFTAAVKEAVTPIQEAANLKVAELQGKLDELTTESEKAELDGQIAEMQSALDIADAKVAAAEKALADTLTYFDELEAARLEAERLEGLKASRRDAVKDAASFSDEKIDEKIDRWVAMSDEDFDSFLDDLRAIVPAATASETEVSTEDEVEKVAETAVENVRSERSNVSVASDVFDARNRGINIREIHI